MKRTFKFSILMTSIALLVSVNVARTQDRHRHVIIIADAGHSAITTDKKFNRTLARFLVAEIDAMGLEYQDHLTLLGFESASMRGLIDSWRVDLTLQYPHYRPEDLSEYLTLKMDQLLSTDAQSGVGTAFWALRFAAARADCEAMDTSVFVLSTLHNEILVVDDGGLSMDPGQAGNAWSGCNTITFLGAGADHNAAENLDPVMLQELLAQYGQSLGFRQIETRW